MTFAPAGAMTPSAEFLFYFKSSIKVYFSVSVIAASV